LGIHAPLQIAVTTAAVLKALFKNRAYGHAHTVAAQYVQEGCQTKICLRKKAPKTKRNKSSQATDL